MNVLSLASLALLPALTIAQGSEESGEGIQDENVTSEHSVVVGGASVPYRAEAGRMVLRRENGEARASIYYTAYFRTDVEVGAERPLTFCFNGGPGSSSVWLHLGAFGPRRVDMGREGFRLDPPYALVDNHASLIDLTDLVFVDPVSTGYSRVAEGEDAAAFHGVRGDVESVGEFIRLYMTRHARWSSPIFLAGESYGTTRAAALSASLQERHGIYPSGVVLVSAILNFLTARADRGNDLPFALILPSFTATAWFHGRLAPELQADLASTLEEVEAFALGSYSGVLLRGDAVPEDERSACARQLARYTGLAPEQVLQANLRVSLPLFTKSLLRDRRRTVGRLDARYRGIDADAAGARPDFDPSYAAIQGPYSMTLNQYVRAELGYESDLPYEILTGRVQPWSYDRWENRYLNVGEDLRRAMSKNRALQVFVANGYYDLATPYFATEYTFAHLGLDPELRGNVRLAYYESGHMMYVQVPSLEKLKADLAAFYADVLAR